MWDLATGEELIHFKTGWILDLAFTPDSQKLVTVSQDAVRVWEVATGQEIQAWTDLSVNHDAGDPAHAATSLAVAPDGKTAATGHADTTILLWGLPPTPASPAYRHRSLTAVEARPHLEGDDRGECQTSLHCYG